MSLLCVYRRVSINETVISNYSIALPIFQIKSIPGCHNLVSWAQRLDESRTVLSISISFRGSFFIFSREESIDDVSLHLCSRSFIGIISTRFYGVHLYWTELVSHWLTYFSHDIEKSEIDRICHKRCTPEHCSPFV